MKWLILLLLVVASSEGFALVLAGLRPEQFRPDSEQIRQAADPDGYALWLRQRYDAEIGWINPRSATFSKKNCASELTSYTFDATGARSSAPLDRVDVIAVGDSFTRGDDVNDDETYPFWIHRLTGLTVANYGVGNSDPLQQVMYLERLTQLHPEFRIAIIGIWDEDLRRLPARLRYVADSEQAPFYFKPYLDVTQAPPKPRPNPNAPPAKTVEQLLPIIEEALNADYLQRPMLSWPYTLAILRLLGSRPFIYGLRNRFNMLRGKQVSGWFEDENLLRGLDYVITRFMTVSYKHNALPVVVFIPSGYENRYSFNQFIAYSQLNKDINRRRSILVNVGDADIDWNRYRISSREGSKCHASKYGYEMIGRFTVNNIRRYWPLEPT